MASTTIIAPAGEKALERARAAAQRQADLDGYEAFRRIKDGYEEAPRPSADDVESVLTVLAGSLSVAAGQNVWSSAESAFEGERLFYTQYTKYDSFQQSHMRKVMQSGIAMAGQDMAEGRSWYLRLSPGVMGLRCSDQNKKERAQEREKDRQRSAVDMAAALLVKGEDGDELPVNGSTGEIREWSARSRSRMSELVGSLDYSDWLQSDGALAMVTLTLPDRWLELAPDGETFKKLLRKFEHRWRRAIGPWRLLWKLEFQRRGAPHWHALMRVPALVGRQTFEEWLSKTWADVVGASKVVDRWDAKTDKGSSEYSRHLAAGTGVDFSGKDFSDPRRISLYFLGHSSKTSDGKEYQHRVPEEWQKPGKGPGRFWGNPGLKSATREIELTERDAVGAARILRKVKRGRAWTTSVLRERGKLPLGDREKHRTFDVELRQKDGQKRGRAAHRTYNRKNAVAAAAKGETYSPQPRFKPASLGGGGYAVGGWVLMNDALQLGLDVARWFGADPGCAPADNLGRGSMAQRWETVALCRAARGAAPLSSCSQL